MANVFDSKYYPAMMYLSILIFFILILFNFVNILEILSKQKNIIIPEKEINLDLNLHKITGFFISEQNQTNISFENATEIDSQELYSKKSYFIYIIIIGSLTSVIFLLFLRIFMPVIKRIT
jgi:hypothetical protein